MRGGTGATSTPVTPSSPLHPSSPPALRVADLSSGVSDTSPGSDPGISDADLLAAHVAGDPNAFTTLVHRHQNRLWATALRMMRNPHDAADALQDAYLAAFRRAEGFRGEAQVTSWLHRIVVNACLDRLRRQQRLRSEQPLPTDPDRAAELVTTTVPDPIEQRELRDELSLALADLNSDQRAALVLVDVEGYAVDEAATILGVPPGTVKSRCARGRARLAVALRTLRAGTSGTGAAGTGAAGREAI